MPSENMRQKQRAETGGRDKGQRQGAGPSCPNRYCLSMTAVKYSK